MRPQDYRPLNVPAGVPVPPVPSILGRWVTYRLHGHGLLLWGRVEAQSGPEKRHLTIDRGSGVVDVIEWGGLVDVLDQRGLLASDRCGRWQVFNMGGLQHGVVDTSTGAVCIEGASLRECRSFAGVQNLLRGGVDKGGKKG